MSHAHVPSKAELDVLVLKYCQRQGYRDAVAALSRSANVSPEQYDLADNVDLEKIVRQYLSESLWKFGERPVLIKDKGARPPAPRPPSVLRPPVVPPPQPMPVVSSGLVAYAPSVVALSPGVPQLTPQGNGLTALAHASLEEAALMKADPVEVPEMLPKYQTRERTSGQHAGSADVIALDTHDLDVLFSAFEFWVPGQAAGGRNKDNALGRLNNDQLKLLHLFAGLKDIYWSTKQLKANKELMAICNTHGLTPEVIATFLCNRKPRLTQAEVDGVPSGKRKRAMHSPEAYQLIGPEGFLPIDPSVHGMDPHGMDRMHPDSQEAAEAHAHAHAQAHAHLHDPSLPNVAANDVIVSTLQQQLAGS